MRYVHPTGIYRQARDDHAMFLRLEGMKLHQIGDRLGVQKERARGMIMKAARRLQRATRHTRFRMIHADQT